MVELLTERAYYFSPSINVGMLLELSGSLTKGDFERALALVGEGNEALRARIELGEGGQLRYAIGDTPKTEIGYLEARGEASWGEWFARNEALPFDLENGELLRLAVFSEAGKSTVCLSGHHLLGDGLSYVYLVERLLEALNGGECSPGKLIPIGISTRLPRGSRLGIAARLYLRGLNEKWRKEGLGYSLKDRYELFVDFHAHRKPMLRLSRLGKDETSALRLNCKERGLSVNDALVAAFMLGQAKLREPDGERVLEFGIPVNVRGELSPPVGKEMGNFVSGVTLRYAYDTRRGFWENAKKIKALIGNKIADRRSRFAALQVQALVSPGLLDSLPFLEFGRDVRPVSVALGKILGLRLADKLTGMSNLGRVAIGKKGGRVNLESIAFIPPAYAGSLLTIGAIGYDDSLSLCLRYFAEEIPEADIEKIESEALKALREPH